MKTTSPVSLFLGSLAFIFISCSKNEDTNHNNSPGQCADFPAPAVNNNGPVNIGSTIELNASSSETGVEYEWTGPGGFTSALQNPIISNAQYSMNGSYSARISNGTCTSSYISTTVQVNTPCQAFTTNTAQVNTSTWNFGSNVTCGPIGGTPNGVIANSVNGSLYIYLKTFNAPQGYGIRQIEYLAIIDSMTVSMKITEQPSGTEYFAQSGSLYIGNNGSSTTYTLCGIPFKSSGSITKTVSAKVICN